jgi:hypothetical protein
MSFADGIGSSCRRFSAMPVAVTGEASDAALPGDGAASEVLT